METTLRFRLAGAIPSALRSRFAKAIPVRQRTYCFDAQDRRLSRAGIALSLRQEGSSWRQAASMPSGKPDIAHELRRPPQRGVPRPEPELHGSTPIGEALRTALGKASLSPTPLFSIDVRRITRTMRAGGARMELALIEGTLRAGDTVRLPVREIELSLKAGPTAALFEAARHWVHGQSMWMDARDLLVRGGLMALGHAAPAPVLAREPAIDAGTTPETAFKHMIRACLEQVLGNAAILAEGSAQAEHLHQLRVGLRRLRSALRLFGAWSPKPVAAWDLALAGLSPALGATRDLDVLQTEVLPRLAALGAPPLPLSDKAPPSEPLQAMLRSPAFTGLMIDLMAYAHDMADTATGTTPTAELARRRLAKFAKRLRVEAEGFPAASDTERHRLRKRLKRLRYGLELAGDLLPHKKSRQALARLKPLQDALGQYNDLCRAEAYFRQMRHSPGAWFAQGWAAARRAELLREATGAVAQWRDSKPRG